MSHRGGIAILASAALSVAGLSVLPERAAAMTGIGCPDLPMYYRAVGTIENGPGSCGLTMAEANAILARGPNGDGVVPGQPAPPPPKYRKHHRRTTHHN